MYKILLIIFIALPLLTGCGTSKWPKSPWKLSSVEMFPHNPMAQKLARAAAQGDIKTLDRLVARGADVNAQGTYGMTVLGWALYNPKYRGDLYPNEKGFRRLLEHGADPNIIWKDPLKEVQDESLLHIAVVESSGIGTSFLKMALEVGKGNPNLFVDNWRGRLITMALDSQTKEAFAVLYNAGAEIDFVDEFGKSLFLHAAWARNYEVAYFLLLQNVDFRRKSNVGQGITNQIEWMLRPQRSDVIAQNENSQEFKWFWLCIDFLEKKGVAINIPQHIKRPKNIERPPSILFTQTQQR